MSTFERKQELLKYLESALKVADTDTDIELSLAENSEWVHVRINGILHAVSVRCDSPLGVFADVCKDLSDYGVLE